MHRSSGFTGGKITEFQRFGRNDGAHAVIPSRGGDAWPHAFSLRKNGIAEHLHEGCLEIMRGIHDLMFSLRWRKAVVGIAAKENRIMHVEVNPDPRRVCQFNDG